MSERGHALESTGLVGFLRESRLNWLLLLVPVSVPFYALGLPKAWLFVLSALAIVPLAGLIGDATEELAARTSPGVGGLLNATFGNATELIISLFALNAGLYEVVKASISGSIIANILLVLGTSMLLGGWRRPKQTFSRTHAGASAAMLFLAVVALIMPAVFDLAVFGRLERTSPALDEISIAVAVVLLLTYLGGLVFSLKTHSIAVTAATAGHEQAKLSTPSSILLLLVTTALVAMESEFLVSAISSATATLGITEFFVGVVVVAIVGNAAEHYSAVEMAIKNKMELSVTIATASSTQIALFVAPMLVFASFAFGKPMSLIFNAYEIAGVTLAVLALSIVSLDGESNWFEGMQLLAVYLVMAIVFFFAPAT